MGESRQITKFKLQIESREARVIKKSNSTIDFDFFYMLLQQIYIYVYNSALWYQVY